MPGFDFFIVFWLAYLFGLGKAINKWGMGEVFVTSLAILLVLFMFEPIYLAGRWLLS